MSRRSQFDVVAWIRKTDTFPALRDELIGLAVLKPDESIEWDEMVAFHWGVDSLMEAESVAEALTVLGQRQELVLLRVSNYYDPTSSIVFKDARDAPH